MLAHLRSPSSNRIDRTSMPRLARGIGFGALLAGALVAPLAAAWVNGLTLVYRDSAMLYAPQRWLVGTALRQFTLPLWNPYAGMGMPLLAETVHGVLHPLSIAAAFLFPDDGLDPLLAAHVVAAGAGAAVLARSVGSTWRSAVTAAFAYGLSGYTLSMTGNLVYLAGAGSAPWLIAGLRLAATRAGFPGFAAGALGVAVCAFSGDVQALAFGGALGLCLAIEAGRGRGLVRAVLSACAGAALAAVQLVPSWAYVRASNRAGAIGAGEEREWALAAWRVVELVSPGFFGRPHGQPVSPVYLTLGGPTSSGAPFAMSIFIGAPVLLFAAWGVRSSRLGRWLLGALLVVAWLALGHRSGAQQLLSALPVVGGLRYAEKHVAHLTLLLAVLAALGIDRVSAEPRGSRRALSTAFAVAAGALVAWAAVATPGLVAAVLHVPAARADAVREKLLVGAAYVALGCAAVGIALLVGRRRAAAIPYAVAAIVWTESALAASYALDPGDPGARLRVAPPLLAAESPGPRALTPLEAQGHVPGAAGGYEDQWALQNASILAPSFNVRHRIDSVGMDSGIRPARYDEVRRAFGAHWGIAARRYGVTHVLLPRGARPPTGGALAGSDDLTGSERWTVPHRPWAFFAAAAEAAPDAARARERLVALDAGGGEGVVVESTAPLRVAPGVVHTIERGVERVEIDAEASGDALLVVNDAFAPGWRATVDGAPVPIWPADVLVRAVPFPAGRHRLAMRYDPPEVRAGLLVSAAGFALLALAWAVLRTRERRRAHGAALAGPAADARDAGGGR